MRLTQLVTIFGLSLVLAAACDDGERGGEFGGDGGSSGRTDAGGPAEQGEGGSAADGASRDARVGDGARAAAQPDAGANESRQPGTADGAPGDVAAGPALADGCPASAPRALNRVRLFPASGRAAELVGARLQGSNSGPTTDFVDLATVAEAPREGGFTEIALANDVRFRYLKLYAEQSRGSVAELELYHDDQRLAGVAFSTVAEPEAEAQQAFDGDPATLFQGALETGNYVGLDLGADALVAAPTFTPPADRAARGEVELASATPGAHIRYTLDGSDPSPQVGAEYGGPIMLGADRTTIKAIAYADCLFDSPVASATYGGGTSSRPAMPGKGLKSYHIGNSLTDTINDWLEPIADSAGVDHTYARWTIPGAPIGWIWEHKGDGFGTPEGAQNIDSFAREFAPIDHVSVQPFSDASIGPQGDAAIGLFSTVQRHSPDVQPWIYAQWPSRDVWKSDGLAAGSEWAEPEWTVPTPPTNWEEAVANQLLYHEAFRQYVDERLEGKGVLIVPGGPALAAVKRAVDAGQIAGISDFFASHFDDDLHLTEKGQYLVALVFYACLYRESPEGSVTAAGSTLTDAQARSYQRIAWETARDYRWSGIAP